jgi:transposase
VSTKDDDSFRALQGRLADLLPRLNERDRRVAMAAEAKSWGWGGISAVQRAAGASRSTIRRGLTELEGDVPEGSSPRVRAPGGGRKKAEVTDSELVDALDALVEPETRGDPESPLRWTTKSTRNLATELTEMGHAVSHSVVAKILRSLKYSLQGTRKTLEGHQHPDRDVWVSNRSSMAVTCGIAGRWSSGMIAGRGGTTALFDLPTAGGVARSAGPEFTLEECGDPGAAS